MLPPSITQPVKMIPSMDFKTKAIVNFKGMTSSEEPDFQKNLLLCMVLLIHANPTLLLNSQGKADHKIQSSTLELGNGLVSLLHQPGMPGVAQEAREALSKLHEPEKIKL